MISTLEGDLLYVMTRCPSSIQYRNCNKISVNMLSVTVLKLRNITRTEEGIAALKAIKGPVCIVWVIMGLKPVCCINEGIVSGAKAIPSIYSKHVSMSYSAAKELVSNMLQNVPSGMTCDGTSGMSSAKTTAKPLKVLINKIISNTSKVERKKGRIRTR